MMQFFFPRTYANPVGCWLEKQSKLASVLEAIELAAITKNKKGCEGGREGGKHRQQQQVA
jgi:hypothetical protein